MIWKGKEIKTVEELMRDGIQQCDNPEEAKEFMALYEAENPHAKTNIGYLAGYYSTVEKHRIFEWFGVEHPYFGKSDPTPEEALALGKSIGESRKL